MQRKAPRKPRPTHCFGMSPEALARYFRARAIDRPYRWLFQRERRVKSYELDMLHNHPVPGLARDLEKEVRAFGASYYCVVKHCYGETMPPNCLTIPYDGVKYFEVEVFSYLGLPTPDPCIARVRCLNIRGLRIRLRKALADLHEGAAFDLAPVLPNDRDAVQWLLDCEATPDALRTQLLQQIIGRLTRAEAQQIADTIAPYIEAAKPGQPGYAARYGLHAPAQA